MQLQYISQSKPVSALVEESLPIYDAVL